MLGSWIGDIVSSRAAEVVTLLSVAVGVFIKINCRNDKHSTNIWNDLAVGPDLVIAATILFVARSDSNHMTIGVLGMTLAQIVIMTLIRKFGWKDENNVDPLIGVIIPNVLGVVLLFLCA